MTNSPQKTTEKKSPARNSRRPPRRGKRPRGQKNTPLPRIQTSPQDRKAAEKEIDASTFIVFDIETTGGNPEKNGITEICALKVENFEVVDRFYSMVNPQTPIPPIVRKMTGITNQMVRNAPKIDEVMPKFVEFIGNGILVSHNTIGDMKFLRYYSAEVLDKPIANFFMCTHLLVERLLSEAPNKSLRGLVDFLKLASSGDMHRADADAEVTMELFKVLVRKLKQKKIYRVEDGIRLQGDYESGMRLGWAIERNQVENLPTSSGVFYLYDFSDKLHFVSSAINLKRDVGKLLRFAQIPRPMLRLVLSSYRLDYKVTSSQLGALRAEGAELGRREVPFNPANWHQRVVNAIYFRMGKHEISAGVGPLEEGSAAAFGPISDRKESRALLEKVVRACGGRVEKRGVFFDKTYLPVVIAYFKGLLSDVEVELVRQQNSLLTKIATKFGNDKVAPLLEVAKKLHKIEKAELTSLLELSGIALVKPLESNEPGVLYRVTNGQIVSHSPFEGEVDDKERDAAFLERQKATLARRTKKAAVRPLTRKECLIINAFLWWAYSSSTNKEGKFIPLS